MGIPALDYSFLENSDIERDPIFESLEIQSEKLIIGLEAVERLHELRVHEIELQCYANSTSDEDFITYTEAEDKKDTGNKEGLLKRLWKKVVELFTRIREKFFSGKRTELPNDAVIQVDKNTHKFLNLLRKSWGSVKTIIAGCLHPIKGRKTGSRVLDALCIAIDALAAGIFFSYINKSRKQAKVYHKYEQTISVGQATAAIYDTLEKDTDATTVSREDFRTITGLEFNKDYMLLGDVASFCLANSSKITKKAESLGIVEIDMDLDIPKKLTKLASGINKILGAMDRFKLNKTGRGVEAKLVDPDKK